MRCQRENRERSTPSGSSTSAETPRLPMRCNVVAHEIPVAQNRDEHQPPTPITHPAPNEFEAAELSPSFLQPAGIAATGVVQDARRRLPGNVRLLELIPRSAWLAPRSPWRWAGGSWCTGRERCLAPRGG